MSRPRLLVVAGGTRRTASTRHRLWNYRPLLESDGVVPEWLEYGGGLIANRAKAAWERVRFLHGLLAKGQGPDVVLVQKVLPPLPIVRRWKASGARVVYDFDDALFTRSLLGETPAQAARRKARFDAVLRESTVVMAGSPPLAEYACTQADHVEVFYPSLRRSLFEGRKPAPLRDGTVRVGWVGHELSLGYLESLVPVLEEAFTRHRSARLVVCSSRRPELAGEVGRRLDFVPWSEQAEMGAAFSFDLAVSPLDPEPWSRARGGRVSVLLSMAAGVPLVASPGGGLEELAAADDAVLFADDPGAWLDQLDRLLGSREERETVGRAARRVIDRHIWADVQYPRWREVVLG